MGKSPLNLSGFSFLVEVVYNGDEQAAINLCKRAGGLTFTVPKKQYERLHIERLLSQGLTKREIAKRLNTSMPRVSYIAKNPKFLEK